jgi:hypothetical protein
VQTKTNKMHGIKIFFCPDFLAVDNLRRWMPIDAIVNGEGWEQMQIGTVLLVNNGSHVIVPSVSPLTFFDELLKALAEDRAFVTSPDQHYDLEISRYQSESIICHRNQRDIHISGSTEYLKSEVLKRMNDAVRLCCLLFPEMRKSESLAELSRKCGP